MSRTYKAVLSGDGIRWLGEVPEAVKRGSEVPVEVVVESEPSLRMTRGERVAALFEELAATDPFREIEDPVAWQRELREERPLPGQDRE